MTPKQLQQHETREALCTILRRVRAQADAQAYDPRIAGFLSTRALRSALPEQLSLVTVRRHLHALARIGTIRNDSFSDELRWQYVTAADRQREIDDAARLARAAELEVALAKHLGLPEEDVVTVYPHTETIVAVDMTTAERLLNAKV